MFFRELDESIQRVINDLGITLKKEFDVNEVYRKDKENEWIQSLRQCKGQYDPEILANLPANASKVFVKYTRYKEATLRAILNNILFNENEKNWQIKPTTKPLLPQGIIEKIVLSIEAMKKMQLEMSPEVQSGQKTITPEDHKVSPEEVEKAVKEYAEKKCQKMEAEMIDQLETIDYIKTCKQVLKSGIRFGTGILRGSFSQTIPEVVYEETRDGVRQVKKTRKMPTAEFIRIWDCYPDMSVTDIDDCDFVWTRDILNKNQLRRLAKREDFFGDVILEYIKEHPKGNAPYKQWELDLRAMSKEREAKTAVRENKYEVLCRWGYIDGETLKNAGFPIEEGQEDEEVLCNIWLLENRVIKFMPNPSPNTITSLKDIYHMFYFDKDESSIFGTGLPKIARDMEFVMGGAIRTALNNIALVGGFQAEVNMDLLDPTEDVEDIRPYRIWKRFGRGVDAQYPAVKPIPLSSYTQDLLNIFDKALMIADLELCMPMWMHTEPEKITEQTLNQIAAKWHMQTITIKDIVKSFDECNESFLTQLYKWNMEFNENEEIKGDYEVKAKGSTALLMKELRLQAFNYLVQTLSEEEKLYIKADKLLLERLRLFVEGAVEEYIRSEEEVEAIKAQMIDKEQLELMKEKIKAEIIYDIAKAEHMKAKAQKTAKDSDLTVLKELSGLEEE